jgi:hypothetical protein
MKVTKTTAGGEVIIFPSLLMAAKDADMERHKFRRILNKYGIVVTPTGSYTFPTIYKTRRQR